MSITKESISFNDFKYNWDMPQNMFDAFFEHLQKDSIETVKDSLVQNLDFIENQLKSEMAGLIWGKNESANIRLQIDNQIIEAIKHFDEADAFVKSIN